MREFPFIFGNFTFTLILLFILFINWKIRIGFDFHFYSLFYLYYNTGNFQKFSKLVNTRARRSGVTEFHNPATPEMTNQINYQVAIQNILYVCITCLLYLHRLVRNYVFYNLFYSFIGSVILITASTVFQSTP